MERIRLALDATWRVQMPEAGNECREDKLNQAGGRKDSAFAVLSA